jgi:hypothetical protein
METPLQSLLTDEQLFYLMFEANTNMSDYQDKTTDCQTVIVFNNFSCN